MRLLIVRLSAFGDIVHALPLAENARLAGATVAWLTEPAYADLLEGNPNLTRVFFADTRAWRRRPFSEETRSAVARLASELESFAADAVLDPQGNWKAAFLARLARAPVVGFAARARREPSSALLCRHPVHPGPQARHVVERNLALLGPPGVPVRRPAPDASYLLDRACPPAEDFLAAQPRPFAVYHAGSARPEKVWGEAPLARVATRLARENSLAPVISWGPGDEARAARLSDLVPEARRIPALPAHGLARVYARASVLVGGDTGPLHLADALGVPTLALFNPTDPSRNGPLRGAALRFGPETRDEEVASAAAALLARQAGPTPASEGADAGARRG